MSDDWFQQQNQREADTKASAYRQRRQRWFDHIQSPPVHDLEIIKASVASMRRLAQELITQNIVPDWYEVEYLAMDYLTNAIHAGACAGTEWLEWRTRPAGKPHISNSTYFLSKYAPPTYGYQPPEANGMHAQRAAEIHTMASVIEQIVSELERSAKEAPTLVPPPQKELAASVPVLSPRQQEILQALHESGVFTSDERKNIPEVARLAEGSDANADAFRQPVANLKRMGLIDSKEGRGGGIWLTPNGKDRAERIRKL